MMSRLRLPIATALVAAVGVLPTWAGDPGEVVAPLLRAREAGALGEVRGQAWAEPARPGGPELPDPSVSVLLLPYSVAFEAQLDAVKASQRDSLGDLSAAGSRVETARAGYESALRFAGGGELILGEVADQQGRIRLTGVPAGDWLLLGWKEAGHSSTRFRMRSKDAKNFPDVPTGMGYTMMEYWRVRVTVRAGESTEVTLTDRNIWLTALKEERRYPDQPAPVPRRR
ncbi:MAG TPA: hypothetical protein VFO18_14765 [Methylomirabilota bacterium]|nr:hypothetical protein [Methylomirabilota bacterium]